MEENTNDTNNTNNTSLLVVKKESIFTKISNFFKNIFGKKKAKEAAKTDILNEPNKGVNQGPDSTFSMDQAQINGNSMAQIQNYALQMQQLQINTNPNSRNINYREEKVEFANEIKKASDDESIIQQVKDNPESLNSMSIDALDMVLQAIINKQNDIKRKISEVKNEISLNMAESQM